MVGHYGQVAEFLGNYVILVPAARTILHHSSHACRSTSVSGRAPRLDRIAPRKPPRTNLGSIRGVWRECNHAYHFLAVPIGRDAPVYLRRAAIACPARWACAGSLRYTRSVGKYSDLDGWPVALGADSTKCLNSRSVRHPCGASR